MRASCRRLRPMLAMPTRLMLVRLPAASPSSRSACNPTPAAVQTHVWEAAECQLMRFESRRMSSCVIRCHARGNSIAVASICMPGQGAHMDSPSAGRQADYTCSEGATQPTVVRNAASKPSPGGTCSQKLHAPGVRALTTSRCFCPDAWSPCTLIRMPRARSCRPWLQPRGHTWAVGNYNI